MKITSSAPSGLALALIAATASGAAVQSQTLPAETFYIGLGGTYADVDFGRQDIYAVGTSNVFDGGALVATGTAAGPASLAMPEASGLAPVLQGGYFRQTTGGDWVWGAKMSYAYLNSSASLRDVRLPQAGEFTLLATGEVTPFTGNAIAQSYETSVTHQFSLLPYAGRTFDRGFFYLGAGPTLSRVETDIGGLLGFADIRVPQDISGAPQDFSSSDWVWGGAVTTGVTYFVSERLFLDLSYVYSRSRSYTGNYSSTFINPGNNPGQVKEGTLVGSSSGRLETQIVALTLNWAF
jgi:opacity protein-like surface antigen